MLAPFVTNRLREGGMLGKHGTAVVAMALATMAAVAEAAPMEFPATAAGRAAAEWVQAFNAGEEAMTTLFRTRFAPGPRTLEQRLERYRAMKSGIGTLTPLRVVDAPDREIVFAATDRQGDTLQVRIGITDDPTPLIAGLQVERDDAGAPPPPTVPDGPPLSEAAIADSIAAAADAMAAAGRFAGVVRIERAGRVLLERAWGEADREAHRPNRVDTKFNLGSINKTFTRAVIAKLVEQGRLALDDPLSRHLPDFPRDKSDRITIGQLLDMRSGLGDFFGARYDATDRSKLRNPRDWFPLFVDQPLEFEPGTRSRYSNAGYAVLGAVAERVTGRSYYDLVRDWVYAPAGMASSDSYGQGEAVDNLAHGYTRDDGHGGRDAAAPHRNDDGRPWRGSPAGGGYSTAQDLTRFVEALAAGRILKKETVPRFYDARLGAGGALTVGMGIAGGSPGVNALVMADDDWVLVVLANVDPPAAETLGRTARGWLRRLQR
jgi:D-alanyl-D-alanine carboxypeptidase